MEQVRKDITNTNTNKVTLAGYLVRDSKEIYREVTKVVYALDVANHRGKKVNFIEVVAELPGPLPKGIHVIVEGSLSQQKWEKDGRKGSAVRINATSVKVIEKKAEKVVAEAEQRVELTPVAAA